MITIQEDIELAKLWANDAPNGQGWRGTCYRLAAEVERLRERNALLELELSVSASALLAGDAAIELAKLEIIRTESENKALRAGLSKVADNIGNGSFASPDCSLQFLTVDVPLEVKLHVSSLNREITGRERERAALARLAEATK